MGDDDLNFVSLKAYQWWPIMNWLGPERGVHEHRMRACNEAGDPIASVPLPIPMDRWPAFVEWLSGMGLRLSPKGPPHLFLFEIVANGCAARIPDFLTPPLHIVLGLGPTRGTSAVASPVSFAWQRHPLWRRAWWVVSNQRWKAFL